MDKQEILADVKKVVAEKVHELNYQTLEQFETEIKQFLEFLRLTNSLPIKEEMISKAEEPKALIEEEEEEEIETKNEEEAEQLYMFERKVRGGMVLGLDGGYIIPERMVRDMGVNHGDKLKIITKRLSQPRNLYWFEIVEKGNEDNPNRQEFKYCKVEREMGEYIVREYYGGDIRIEEVPFTFIIDEQDVDTFELKDGDIIDIAFYKDNPTSTMKVLYKYELHEQIGLTLEQKKLNHPNRKSYIEAQEKDYVVNKKLFENKKVLIVGGGTRKPEYLQALENLGAKVEHATGDEDKKRLSSMISRTDVVAIALGECSHDASIYTVAECKKTGKYFSSTHSNGIQSILLCVEEAIKKSEKLAS